MNFVSNRSTTLIFLCCWLKLHSPECHAEPEVEFWFLSTMPNDYFNNDCFTPNEISIMTVSPRMKFEYHNIEYQNRITELHKCNFQWHNWIYEFWGMSHLIVYAMKDNCATGWPCEEIWRMARCVEQYLILWHVSIWPSQLDHITFYFKQGQTGKQRFYSIKSTL
jgi:hypothetical protein